MPDFPNCPSNEEIMQKGEEIEWRDSGGNSNNEFLLIDVKSRVVYNFDHVGGGRQFAFQFNENWKVIDSWVKRTGSDWCGATVYAFIPFVEEFLSHIRNQYEYRESDYE